MAMAESNNAAEALKELNETFEYSKSELLHRFLKDQEDITKKLEEYDLSPSDEDAVFFASEQMDIVTRTDSKKKSKHRKQLIRVEIRPKTATGFRGACVSEDENQETPPPPRPSPEPVGGAAVRRDSSTCACVSVDSSYRNCGRTSSIGQLSNTSYDGYARSNQMGLKTRHISVDDPSYLGSMENRYIRRQNSNSAILLKKSQTISGISMSLAESPAKPISMLKLPPLTDGAVVSQPLTRGNLVSGRH